MRSKHGRRNDHNRRGDTRVCPGNDYHRKDGTGYVFQSATVADKRNRHTAIEVKIKECPAGGYPGLPCTFSSIDRTSLQGYHAGLAESFFWHFWL